MTVSSTASRVDYTGNGSNTQFPYTFEISATTSLEVYVAGILKTLNTDYTVSGAGNASGGTVTFNTAPIANATVALVRAEPYTQATDLTANDALPAETVENAFDKLTFLVQQVKELVTRTWRFAAGSDFADTGYIIPTPKAGTYPRVTSDCSGIEFVALTSAGTYADPVTIKGDMIIGGDDGCQSRLALGSTGYGVRVHPHTGKPTWQESGTVVLTNKTDAQADAGRLFNLDADCNSAFVATSTQTCGRVSVVTPAAISDDCQGFVLLSGGPISLRSQGNIGRGEWVRSAATAGAVETTCVSMKHHRPVPRGTVGLALTDAAADCVTILKFPMPSNGMQGLPAVRNNRSQTCTSSNALTCNAVMLIADALQLVDCNNDIVIVRQPNPVTNDIRTDPTNKKDGRDQVTAFSAGDVHFYFVYEGCSGTVSSRSSVRTPRDGGPTMPSCETNWTYSHSAYFDGLCLPILTLRGRSVYFDCHRRVTNLTNVTCTIRVSLATCVPAIATQARFQVSFDPGPSTTPTLIMYRLNCIAYTVVPESTTGAANMMAVTIPVTATQDFFVRQTGNVGPFIMDLVSYDVPSGD